MEEIFKDIPEYLGIYQVSTLGNVRSLDRFSENKPGIFHKIKGQVLKIGVNSRNGYSQVGLYHTNNKFKTCKPHRLVAAAFIPNPDNKPEVNHKDGNKQNNCVDNLEWATSKENKEHGHRTGLYDGNRGWMHYESKMIIDQQTGIFYANSIEAAHAKGLNSRTLRHKLKGEIKNNTFLIYA